MILEADNILLFIHPKSKGDKPLIDNFTKAIYYATTNPTRENCGVCSYKKPKQKDANIAFDTGFMGTHTCTAGCGARSA